MSWPDRLTHWVGDPTHRREFMGWVANLRVAQDPDSVEIPPLVRGWMEEDLWGKKIILAYRAGVVDARRHVGLGDGAEKRGYTSRSFEGDAYEEGHRLGSERRHRRLFP